jgi:hypothetical protein
MGESDRRAEDSIEKSQPMQRSDVLAEPLSGVEAQRRLEDVLLAVMERLRWEEKERPAKIQDYPFPFIVDEDFIRKLNRRATEWLERAGIMDNHTISVLAEARFDDLSTSRFPTLDDFLDRAGDRRDPQGVTVEWSAVLRQPVASTAKIQAVFTTEKPLRVGELGWFEFSAANMKLEIVGPDRQWVDNTYSELDPLFASVRLGGVHRPFLIFRNRNVIAIASWASGIYVQLSFFGLIEWLKQPQINDKRQAQLNQILTQPTAEAKIDQLAREVFRPLQDNTIFDTLWLLMISFIAAVVITVIGYKFYPKLVPRTGINIGLAATRYASYFNLYHFLFITLIFMGVIVPLLRSRLYSWLF